MKYFISIAACCVALTGLSACAANTVQTYDETPYEHRTAGEGVVVKDIERMKSCDCSHWKKRAGKAEEKLRRFQQQFHESLRK